MGGVSVDGGKGGNVDVNVVPFIDLLSALVLFLLLNAVWIQISGIGTNIDAKGGVPVVNPDIKVLAVQVTTKGYSLRWPQDYATMQLPAEIAKNAKGYDVDQLAAVANRLVKQGLQPITAVAGDDTVDYGEVVRAIDAVRSGGLQQVALSAN
jgi:biopolymer transport protein ExbD